MKIVFIAGPYFGDGKKETIQRNVREAERYQVALANVGVPFFCAHNHTEHFEEKASAPEEFYKTMDMEFLKRAADAVLAVPGWENSPGARDEIRYAEEHSVPVFYPKSTNELGEVIKWAKSR